MNYQAFTDETLLMMHHGARGALVTDDELIRFGEHPRFKVRDTLNWTMHIAELEAEMVRRGMTFDVIVWSMSGGQQPHQPRSTEAADGPTHLSARIAAAMRIRRS
jgi:hypothetical protein